MAIIIPDPKNDLERIILEQCTKIQARIQPEHIPTVPGIEIYGQTRQLHQFKGEDKYKINVGIGGDYFGFIGFDQRYDLTRRIQETKKLEQEGQLSKEEAKKIMTELQRNFHRFGIILADIRGHEIQSVYDAQTMHEMFQLGSLLEIARSGEITTRLIEAINLRFSQARYLKSDDNVASATLFYGELYASGIDVPGRFRYVCAGEPAPLVYSAERDTIYDLMELQIKGGQHYAGLGLELWGDHPDVLKYSGVLPNRKRIRPAEIELMMPGDILVKFTDGLPDRGDGAFVTQVLHSTLRQYKHAPAKEIVFRIQDAADSYAEQEDDCTVIVGKRVA